MAGVLGLPDKREVGGSSPPSPTKNPGPKARGGFLGLGFSVDHQGIGDEVVPGLALGVEEGPEVAEAQE